jgi:hypothetical protein
MQLIPRYLVNDRINIISNEVGFPVEYRPVYSRTLKVYRGIDNKIQFRLLNADQKPVRITSTPIFVAFDDENNLIIETECTVTDDNSTTATRGMFHVTIDENLLLNVKQQYLHYNVYLDGNVKELTYAGRNFESAGIIYVNGNAFPGPRSSTTVDTFFPVNDYWTAGSNDTDKITAQPGINDNEALHTVVVYSTEYVGNIEVQVTLDNQITGQNNWTTVSTLVFDGTETEPVPLNLNGVFSYMRFKFDVDPNDKISKILIRN